MPVLIMPSGYQTFIDTDAAERLARAAANVTLKHRGPMQRQYELTLPPSPEDPQPTPCQIVTTTPSDADAILAAAVTRTKPARAKERGHA